MNEKELWQAVLNEIELQVSKANYITWFKNTYIDSKDAGVVCVAVPNGFSKEWLENKYNKYILKALRSNANEVKEVRYIIKNKRPQAEILEPEKEDAIKELQETQLQFEEFKVDKNTNLNPKYTLSSFVVGPSNELAHAASQAIVKNPGLVYNPLFIHVPTGLGKTHLIQAIGNAFKNNSNGNKKIYYTTSEKFFLDYINSVQVNKISVFKEKYRKYDVFIMDDIQFFSGKQATQDELFHLFNSLYDNNKQIIFSSDKHCNNIPDIEERLKRIIDLMAPFQKKYYYVPEMQGSYSIKYVLPALVPDMSYEGMEIGEGGDAMIAFESLLNETDSKVIEKTRKN